MVQTKEEYLQYYRDYFKKNKAKHDESKNKYYLNDVRRYLIKGAKARCKKKGIEFNLKREDIFIPDKCPVLGFPLRTYIGKGTGAKFDSISLDRIDPAKGYTRGNVIVISRKANAIKSNATSSEILKVGYFYKYLDVVRGLLKDQKDVGKIMEALDYVEKEKKPSGEDNKKNQATNSKE